MPKRFTFKSAIFRDEFGKPFALTHARTDSGGSQRRPIRLQLSAANHGTRKDTTLATIELSRVEAYALSEWLDSAVTQLPGDKRRESRRDNPPAAPRA